MKKVDWKELELKPHNVVVAVTSYPDYEMSRHFLLEVSFREYVVLEGWHCSCYDFDETEWEAIEYTYDELKKLANADYNTENDFWQQVRKQLN